MPDLIPTGGNAFTNTGRTTGCDAALPSEPAPTRRFSEGARVVHRASGRAGFVQDAFRLGVDFACGVRWDKPGDYGCGHVHYVAVFREAELDAEVVDD